MPTYYGKTYFSSCLSHSEQAKKRDLNGTSISDEKGTDNKANNTSAYNHDYYMKNKDKWEDNDGSSGASSSQEKYFDVDAAATDVIKGKYGNGQARRDALGDDYEMVQKRVNELLGSGKVSSSSSSSNATASSNGTSEDGSSDTSEAGATYGNQWYYSHLRKIDSYKQSLRDKENAKKAEEEKQRLIQEEAARKEQEKAEKEAEKTRKAAEKKQKEAEKAAKAAAKAAKNK